MVEIKLKSYDEIFDKWKIPYVSTPNPTKKDNLLLYSESIYGHLMNYNLLNSNDQIYTNSLDAIVEKSAKMDENYHVVLENNKFYYFLTRENMKKLKLFVDLFY